MLSSKIKVSVIYNIVFLRLDGIFFGEKLRRNYTYPIIRIMKSPVGKEICTG